MTASSKISSIKGFKDLLPDETARRRRLTDAACRVLETYGYGCIDLPLLEQSALFTMSVGVTTDIVEKEMYAFEDRDGTVIALRPEATASVVRAYIQAGLSRSSPVSRFYYVGPMFRRERPQKGRLRQFHQIGAEFLGREDAAADAETICLVDDICRAAKLKGYRIRLNSLGDGECRPAYREALKAYAAARVDELCADCRTRIERNPLRLLDCKQPGCNAAMSDAPMMVDHLSEACKEHHERVLSLLDEMGVETEPDPRMVRGLDYYCRTAFEIVAEGLGAQDSVGGGGRYDGLVESLGGPSTAGVGFAFGIERMELASSLGGGALARAEKVTVVPLDPRAEAPALVLARSMRAVGLDVEVGPSAQKLKAQMKRADKAGARWVVIVGDDELSSRLATVRDMTKKKDYPSCLPLDAGTDAVEAKLRELGVTFGGS